MENISKFLGAAFNIIVFFIAVTILYAMSSQYNKLAESSMNNVPTNEMMYEGEPTDTDNQVPKSELASLFMSDLEYDTEVIDESGTYIVPAAGYSPDYIGLFPLSGEIYEKSYQYNMDGTISRIVFRYMP